MNEVHSIGLGHDQALDEVLLDVQDLIVQFSVGRGETVHAVSGVSFQVMRGETLGIVGESGCGKSSLAKALVRLNKPTSGAVCFGGRDLASLEGAELREVRARLQMIFQDPISSLNPRRRINAIVEEPLKVWGRGTTVERRDRVGALLEQVGIDPQVGRTRRPGELSGGQCQRVSIARALALDPELIICDEPVSALDVSVQAQVLNLLEELKKQFDLTLVFISHDLSVVKSISDRVAVMYLGHMIEVAPAQELYDAPRHPYSYGLLSAIPNSDPIRARTEHRHEGLQGELPSPLNPPSGCRFRTRCPRAQEVCSSTVPRLAEVSAGHQVACHFPLTESDRSRAADAGMQALALP